MYIIDFLLYIKNQCPMCGYGIKHNQNKEYYYCIQCQTFKFDTYKLFAEYDYELVLFDITFTFKDYQISYYFISNILDIRIKDDYRYKTIFSQKYEKAQFLDKFCCNYEKLNYYFNKYILLL